MNGKELLSRVFTSVQEMTLKIGDSLGSVSLYYPFEGNYDVIRSEFLEASSEAFPNIIIEHLPQRLRITIPEEDCKRISGLPTKRTMTDIIGLTKDRISISEFRKRIREAYPDSIISESGCMDFDWVLVFPGMDEDVYCISEELGQVTYHRFSAEEFLALGFELPERIA